MSVKKLFGTDGVRGKAGDYPLDRATVARLGAALVRAMREAASRFTTVDLPTLDRPTNASSAKPSPG